MNENDDDAALPDYMRSVEEFTAYQRRKAQAEGLSPTRRTPGASWRRPAA